MRNGRIRVRSFTFLNNVLYFIPFTIKFRSFIFLLIIFPSTPSVGHFDTVLKSSFRQGFFAVHVTAVLFLRIEIPSTDRSLFIAEIHFRIIYFVIWIFDSVMHLFQTGIAFGVTRWFGSQFRQQPGYARFLTWFLLVFTAGFDSWRGFFIIFSVGEIINDFLLRLIPFIGARNVIARFRINRFILK